MPFCTRAPVNSTPRPSTFLCSFSHASNSPSPQPRSRTRVSGSTNSPMIAKSRRPYTSRTRLDSLARFLFERAAEESTHQCGLLLHFDEERVVAIARFQIAIGHVGVAAPQGAYDFERLVAGIQP